MRVGETWNESVAFPDAVTGRPTRRLTRAGLYNETPTYHLNACFSRDSRQMVFASAREGGSCVIKADVATGDLTCVAVTDGIGNARGVAALAEVMPYAAGSLGGGFTGNHMAICQASGWVVACVGASLRAYHLETLEERVLIADIGAAYRMGNPISAVDGKSVLVPRSPVHPDVLKGDKRTGRTYFEAVTAEFGGCPVTYLQVDLASGAVREVFSEKVAGSNHVQPCPVDPDLWLIDRDYPPKYAHGSDGGKTSRAWLLRVSTGEMTEIRPRHANRFQIHTNWNAAGTRVYYHGRNFAPGATDHYVGVADTTGAIVWEQTYPVFHYGHVSVHTGAEAIVTDGLITPDLVTAIHYEERDRNGLPRVEVLARHGTILDALRGQYPHPHPHMSPDARWLAYNKAELGRTDVFVVSV